VRNDRVAALLINFRKTCYSGCESKFEDFLGPDIYPRLLGRMLSLFAAGPDKGKKYDQFLDEIPNMPQRLQKPETKLDGIHDNSGVVLPLFPFS